MPPINHQWGKAVMSIAMVLIAVACQAETGHGEEAALGNNAASVPWLTVINRQPKLVDRYSNSPDDLIEAVGGGPFISFSGLPGHLPGDSERTAVEIRARSHASSDVEETAVDVEMQDDSGLTYLWLPARSYPAGALVANAKNIYQATTACHSAASGSGPSGKGAERDGTCQWVYRHIDNDGKSAALFSGVIKGNGGKLWGQAIDVIADAGSMGSDRGLPGGLMVGQEIDSGNFAKDCPVTPSDCLVTGVFLAGFSKYAGTSGILGGGQPPKNPLYHEGVTLLPHFASDVAFNDDTSADIGFESGGQHRLYTFRDISESPTSISISGMHSFAGILDDVSSVAFFSGGRHSESSFYDSSVSGVSIHVKGQHTLAAYYDDSVSTTAVELRGSYKTQISANGFIVDAGGNTTVRSIKTLPVRVKDLPKCVSANEGIFAGVVDAASSGYLDEVKGGGRLHIPVYCDGVEWVEH